ncbi:transcriptional regulator with XRE-family HTH domain [Peribacillus deserti]|uniref:Transcriptional regulator with XRE-family HTH domain n=1 Tax=Peribacillus deserti TaxID=673318 RepID=A0ABS2QCS2_9BACI|nr:helix-turn-helix domain-containing protein [Peribacillus deserti]MBM7690897.1 transcriptional regulator with XRE-family HTH domain [Peribacillus deserti]
MDGNAFRRLRIKKGYSITQLAERTGISKSYLSYIERGLQQNPSINILTKIAQVLDCSVDDLMGETISDMTLDKEWVNLIMEAKQQGISKDEFRLWLEFNIFKKVQINNETKK